MANTFVMAIVELRIGSSLVKCLYVEGNCFMAFVPTETTVINTHIGYVGSTWKQLKRIGTYSIADRYFLNASISSICTDQEQIQKLIGSNLSVSEMLKWLLPSLKVA
jgi:hypothetical protein